MRRCPQCNEENEEQDRYCNSCGSPLDASESSSEIDDDTLILHVFDERPEQAVERRAAVWLLDPSGEHVARALELKDEVTVIGRQHGCAISLASSTVSRRHAHIRREGAQFFLQDLNSTNGTLLNGESVIGEELLHDRDEIGIGIYRLIFRYS